MKMQLTIAMILSTVLLTNCKNDVDLTENKSALNGYQINYGVSFGFCVGPCRREMKLINDVNSFTIFYTEGRGAVGGTPKEYQESISQELAENILQTIDYESFSKMNEVIGCPDCADGGAEYLEIIKENSKHKVTFEYGKSPKEIEKLVAILREKRVLFEDKYLK